MRAEPCVSQPWFIYRMTRVCSQIIDRKWAKFLVIFGPNLAFTKWVHFWFFQAIRMPKLSDLHLKWPTSVCYLRAPMLGWRYNLLALHFLTRNNTGWFCYQVTFSTWPHVDSMFNSLLLFATKLNHTEGDSVRIENIVALHHETIYVKFEISKRAEGLMKAASLKLCCVRQSRRSSLWALKRTIELCLLSCFYDMPFKHLK